MATHYEVLGVPVDAAPAEIRRAYHDAARRHHPDLHVAAGAEFVESARRRMAEINAAWAVLGDPARRRAYDSELGARAASVGRGAFVAEPNERPAWDAEVDLDPSPPDIRRQSVVMVPVGLVGVATGLFAFSVVSGIGAFMAVAIVLLALAAVAFVAAPLLMLRSRR